MARRRNPGPPAGFTEATRVFTNYMGDQTFTVVWYSKNHTFALNYQPWDNDLNTFTWGPTHFEYGIPIYTGDERQVAWMGKPGEPIHMSSITMREAGLYAYLTMEQMNERMAELLTDPEANFEPIE
jgi:hypothetical protein